MVEKQIRKQDTVDGEEARLLFRLVNGVMGKMYVTDIPLWVQAILLVICVIENRPTFTGSVMACP